ncbi:hypothetical protein ABPG74_002818 [Tetrahymena malaccensis]
MKLTKQSITNFACKIPDDLPDTQCSSNCANIPSCNLLGYYQNGGSCQKVVDKKNDCLNNPVCGPQYIDSICRSSGYIGDDKGVCIELQASDCLNLIPQNIATYCNGSSSACAQKYKFILDRNQQICTFDCLQGLNCLDGSFCLKISSTELGAFGYSAFNSQGKCYIDLSLDDCVKYKSNKYIYCPQACVTKYNLIQSPNGCLLPSHSDCDNATENSKYGCSTDKYLCKYLGWTQILKGLNQCQDPTNICLSQYQLCNQNDSQQYTKKGQNTSLGNYLGLIFDVVTGWKVPKIEQCYDQNLCQRPQGFCRKSGFILNPQTNNCGIPNMIKDCLGQDKCSDKLTTICKVQYGFTNISNNQRSACAIPQNCGQLKKDFDSHACEIGGFVSLDKDMYFVDSKDIYNNLNINIDLNYNITLSYCLTQIQMKNTICSSGTSVCNLIGFQTNKDGTCQYPQIDSCLVSGTGKCSKNNICLRYFKLEKSQTSDDCVIPNKGDYTKCQYSLETPRVLLHYCFTYFGFKFIAASKLCASQPSNSFCTSTYSQFCNIFNTSISCTYTTYTYVQYNNYIQYDDIGLNNPLDYIFSKCTVDSCSEKCTLLGFNNCKIPQAQTCSLYDGNNYNHACHMMRAINAIDVYNLCFNQPNCSKVCQFYGFIQGQDNSCQIPDSATCSVIGKTLDAFYHACGFQNFKNPNKIFVSQYCLQRGLNMCSSQDSICVKYYNFAKSADGSGDCQNPNVLSCLKLNKQIIPINCQVMVGFILKPVKQLFIYLTQDDYVNLNQDQLGLAQELGLLLTSDNKSKIPEPFDCLKNPICATPKRFGNASPAPYNTYCINQGFSVAQDGKSCFVDVNTCVKPGQACSTACQFSGFAKNINDQTCLIMDIDQFYCDPTYKVKSDYCEQLGYKWVNDHYEYPTHAECEDNTNGYCGQGKITCTERGWTAVNGQCQYKINCLDMMSNYCQNSISICYYLGYTQIINQQDNALYYDCGIPENLNCLAQGNKNCASKKYSICTQSGFVQGNNSECICSGLVYQGACYIVNNNQKGNTNTQASLLRQTIIYLFIIFLLFK